ncbi:MAG: hypothetical protein OHK0050_13320 [Roseiflexaceae bacterium]
MADTSTKQLTDESYWSAMWGQPHRLYERTWTFDPAVQEQLRVIRRLIEQVRRSERPVRILEVGCGQSLWLPALAIPGVEVYGIDYSVLGCKQAVDLLTRAGKHGHIWCEDFFASAEHTTEWFDLIISFGFIEHFDDTAVPLRAMYQMLVPGGLIFATVPNLKGIYGPLQQRLDIEVYRTHTLLDDQSIAVHAQRAQLTVQHAGYIGGAMHLGLLNFKVVRGRWHALLMKVLAMGARSFDLGVMTIITQLGLSRPNRIGSPYVYLVAQREA